MALAALSYFTVEQLRGLQDEGAERAKLGAAQAGYQALVAAFETEMLPLLKADSGVGDAVRAVDDKLDAEETNARVEALAQAAQKIGDVVRLISDIAGQTNLLAPNATIRAA